MSNTLAAALQELRAKAVTRRIDLTASLEDALGPGQEKDLGIMTRGLFKTCMSALFGHAQLTVTSIDMICDAWGAGEPGGGYTYVKWRKFATDFDGIPVPAPPSAPTRHFTGREQSDVFSLAPGRSKARLGRRPHGDLRSASDVHFGGPEDVLPTASLVQGRSDFITHSQFVLQGPDNISHDVLLAQAAAAGRRNPFAGMRSQETVGASRESAQKPVKIPSPLRHKMAEKEFAFTDVQVGHTHSLLLAVEVILLPASEHLLIELLFVVDERPLCQLSSVRLEEKLHNWYSTALSTLARQNIHVTFTGCGRLCPCFSPFERAHSLV